MECDELAVAMKALGHPLRVRILNQLAETNSHCCGDFCACIPLAQSTIYQHLDILRKAGLIDCTLEGNRSVFSINKEALTRISMHLNVLTADLALDPKKMKPPV